MPFIIKEYCQAQTSAEKKIFLARLSAIGDAVLEIQAEKIQKELKERQNQDG